MPTFVVKCYPGIFRAVKRGMRTIEQLLDQGFQDGDKIVYREFDAADDDWTGDELAVVISNVSRHPIPGIPKGEARMAIAPTVLPIEVPGDLREEVLREERKRRDAQGTEDL